MVISYRVQSVPNPSHMWLAGFWVRNSISVKNRLKIKYKVKFNRGLPPSPKQPLFTFEIRKKVLTTLFRILRQFLTNVLYVLQDFEKWLREETNLDRPLFIKFSQFKVEISQHWVAPNSI